MTDKYNAEINKSFLSVGSKNQKKIVKKFTNKKFNRKKHNKKSGKPNHLIIKRKIKVCSFSLIIIFCIFIITSVIIKFSLKKFIKIRRANREFEQGSQLNNIISSSSSSSDKAKLDEKEGEKEKVEKTSLNGISNRSLTFSLSNQIDEEYLSLLENHLKTEKIYNYNDFPLPPVPSTSSMHGPFSEEDKENLREVAKFTKLNRELILLTPIPKEMISHPKVSIYGSAYNTDKFLPYLIRSIQNQNLTEWELLIANDGSTDYSLRILNIFAKYDQRIKVINFEKNRGLGYALSIEVEKASGEYLIYVDSDDYEANYDSLYSLYKTGKETGAEFIKSNQAWAWDDTFYQNIFHSTDMPNQLIPIKNYPEDIIKGQYHKIGFGGLHNDAVCAPLLKQVFEDIKDIFKNSKVKLFGFTDVVITTAAALKANTLYYLPKFTYYYDNRSRKDTKRSTWEDKNLLSDQFAHLVYLRICLRFTESDNALAAIIDRFKEQYEKEDFNKINKYYKEDSIIFCGDLEERLQKAKFFEKYNNNSDYADKINLVKNKCNLIRNANVTIIINE